MSYPRPIWLAILLGLVVAGTAGAWWTFQRPHRVVDDALTKLAQATTQRFTAALELENNPATTATLGEAAHVHLNLQGVFKRQSSRPALQSAVTLTMRSESVSLELDGEVRFVDDQAYFLISKTPPVFPAILQLKGKWVTIPRGGDTEDQSAPPPGQLFTTIKSTGSAERHGVRTHRYEATATQAAVVRFMNALAQVLGTQLTDQQLTELKEGMAKVETVPVTFWITPLSHQLKALEATLVVPGGNTVHLSLDLLDRNQPATITPPDNATSLEAALSAS